VWAKKMGLKWYWQEDSIAPSTQLFLVHIVQHTDEKWTKPPLKTIEEAEAMANEVLEDLLPAPTALLRCRASLHKQIGAKRERNDDYHQLHHDEPPRKNLRFTDLPPAVEPGLHQQHHTLHVTILEALECNQ
jgi:hypothetical protein